jgi:CheY-like chemotaxis protein
MPNSTSTNTVLIIDDDNAIRKLFSLLLKNHHYQVLQGASRMVAIKQLETHKEIGVILLDLGMPPAENVM